MLYPLSYGRLSFAVTVHQAERPSRLLAFDYPTMSTKPNKTYADFPLFPLRHPKKGQEEPGKMHYFGPWNNPEAALKKYYWVYHSTHLLPRNLGSHPHCVLILPSQTAFFLPRWPDYFPRC